MDNSVFHTSEVEALLEFYAANGVDCPLDDQPHDRFREMRDARQARINAMAQKDNGTQNLTQQASNPPPNSQPTRAPARPSVSNNQTIPDAVAIETARERASTANTLEELHASLQEFDGCNLKRTAKNLVFADGNPDAQIMLVGEAPGRDEDVQGIPFVGRSGLILNKMLAAIGLNRESDVYIANVVPWRPPGNRTPTPQETELCRPFIERQIALVNPDILVPLGGAAAKQLLQTSDGILKLRGKRRPYKTGDREIDAIATLHPAYLLRQPAQKRLAWQDLQLLKKRLAEIGPKKA